MGEHIGMTMKIVGVRFKPAGKVYDFDGGAFVLAPGDEVIVETEQGLSFGTVAAPAKFKARRATRPAAPLSPNFFRISARSASMPSRYLESERIFSASAAIFSPQASFWISSGTIFLPATMLASPTHGTRISNRPIQ